VKCPSATKGLGDVGDINDYSEEIPSLKLWIKVRDAKKAESEGRRISSTTGYSGTID